MDDNRIRPGVWIGVIGALAVLGVGVWLMQPGSRSARPAAAPEEPASQEQEPSAAPLASGRREPRAATPKPAAVQEEVPYIEGLVYGDIDLREAKALMPDNIYWQQGAPTKDPEELARREAEKKRRNEEYGKVLAGDASEDEVRAYYDYKKKVSSDYLEFSEFMARRFRESKNQELVGLLELATKMHAEKLKALPGELEDALQRAREREKIRADWARQKEEFGNVEEEPSESGGDPEDRP